MKGKLMKKSIVIILTLLFLLGLTACGEPGQGTPSTTTIPATTDAGEITQPATTAAATQPPVKTTEPVEEEAYSILYEGVELIPGRAFDPAVLPAANSVYQVPSCAIEGTDNVYNYGKLELTAFDDGTGEIIYSIYLTDANTPTTEGLYLGDDLARVTELYGEGGTEGANQRTYQKGNTLLVIIFDGDYVASIEYRCVI